MRRWIAAQGPLVNTVSDFWRMVLESESQLIVMVTQLVQNGREKSAKYWPKLHTELVVDDEITVRTESEKSPEDGVIERTFSLQTTTSCGDTIAREIKQLQFVDWPDHGVPDDSANFLKFYHKMLGYQAELNENLPTIIHCSAGVGRTGVTIGFDTAVRLLENNLPVDPLETLLEMRRQRACLIQTADQFIFFAKTVLKYYYESKSRLIKHIEL